MSPGPGRTNGMPEWVQTTAPQVNAKCDVVIKLSVFGTRTDTHTQGKTYTSSLRGL